MTENVISTADLAGANQTLDLLVAQLRELRSRGIQPSTEELVRACVEDDTAMRALARVSLLLTLALQRLADGQ